jgi:hypothetical protein
LFQRPADNNADRTPCCCRRNDIYGVVGHHDEHFQPDRNHNAEGANSRIAMGVSVIGGMIVSTFLTLFVVPAVYTYFATKRKKEE